jgi:hypothetical protein
MGKEFSDQATPELPRETTLRNYVAPGAVRRVFNSLPAFQRHITANAT